MFFCTEGRLLRLLFLRGSLALVISLWVALSVSAEPDRKNVLLIISDDLNRMISPLGDPNAITPNLDALAERSVNFTNASCQFPLCAPSRTSLFTGMYPWIHGNIGGASSYPNPNAVFPDRVSMPEYFRQQGYWTASFGKTEHFYRERNWDLQTADPRVGGSKAHLDRDKLVHMDSIWAQGISGTPTVTVYDLPADGFQDGRTATVALAALHAHIEKEDAEPFFVAVGFEEPHSPWEVPQEIYDLYDPSTFVLNNSSPDSWPQWALKKNSTTHSLAPISDERRRDLLHAYLSSVTQMDRQLGRITTFLTQRNLWEDTIVVFLSDNGLSLCEHKRLFSKRNVSRETVSVPFMIHAPGLQSNVQCHRQVELQDVFPTVMDLCALPPYPGQVDGRSVRPLLENPEEEWPYVAKSVLAHARLSSATARIVQYGSLKIAEGEGVNTMLLDHALDPTEVQPQLSYLRTFLPKEAKWEPLLRSLREDFGFNTGQKFVFYPKSSKNAPDRDHDGVPDAVEGSLSRLGFCIWEDNSDLWKSFRSGPRINTARTRSGPSLYTIEMPGLTALDPTAASTQPPLFLYESDDLKRWYPSDAIFEVYSDGRFRWSKRTPPTGRRYFRVQGPRF